MRAESVCAFIGHRQVWTPVETRLEEEAERFLLKADHAVFLVGGGGQFDTYAVRTVRLLKRRYPARDISLRLVLPSVQYLPKPEYWKIFQEPYDRVLVCDASDGAHYKAMLGLRNRWMIEQSDLLIAYVHTDYGGAYQALRYAQKCGTPTVLL